MVTECLDYRITDSILFTFLKDNKYNILELRLLLFWARHPNAKLSLHTIASALDTARLNLREAISSLVSRGCLIEQHNSNELTTYSLSNDQNTHEYIEELGRMDWNQIKILEKQLEGAATLG